MGVREWACGPIVSTEPDIKQSHQIW